ncbi:MAG: hypothetical protein LBE59_04745 [Nevskiaceae bacterium]|jgi:hypothetical protein|nr:hypothetical protein [Nevskiaceae bacterium]
MDFSLFCAALQNSGLAQWINTTRGVYTIIECVHVIAITLVFGAILVIDLRLLGVASNNRPFSSVSRDLLRWCWIGFVIAALTGAMLFLPNAISIGQNRQFWIKMALIVVAGINMMIFELVTARSVAVWDNTLPTPVAARVSAALSILLWTAVIVFGRLVGFTAVVDDPFAEVL